MSGTPQQVVELTRGTDSNVTADALFSVLTDRRRRLALSRLAAHDDPLSLADLADELACETHDERLAEIPAEEVKRIYLSLYHNHVPRMAEAGLIEYSQERDLIALTTAAERFVPCLFDDRESAGEGGDVVDERDAGDGGT